ncbi:MAG: glycosyltransferase 87 family protein [Anaerolineales bacterium]
MNGFDFGVLWQAGRAVLDGQSPYSVAHFFYPLPVAYLFATFALIPQRIAFGVWLAANAGLLVFMLRKRVVAWALYFPVLHMFSSGQVDLVLWALGARMRSGWTAALAGAAITLKPQVALVLLPWHLLRWLRSDRRTFARWAVSVAALWGGFLLLRPGWPREWLAAAPQFGYTTRGNAPSLWAIERHASWSVAAIALLAVLVFAWGVLQQRKVAWAAAALANPVGLFYDHVVLTAAAPAWLLVPLSWAAVGLTVWLGSFVPWMLLPLAVIAYQRRRAGADGG